MKEFSKETITIDGKEYTLFLNRKGIVAWEKITNFGEKYKDIADRYNNVIAKEEIEVKDGDDPFEISNTEKVDDIEIESQEVIEDYIKLYWIMLYDSHKLTISETRELWNKAVNGTESEPGYGVQQLMDLASQMIEDANTNMVEVKEPKKLEALRPKEN